MLLVLFSHIMQYRKVKTERDLYLHCTKTVTKLEISVLTYGTTSNSYSLLSTELLAPRIVMDV